MIDKQRTVVCPISNQLCRVLGEENLSGIKMLRVQRIVVLACYIIRDPDTDQDLSGVDLSKLIESYGG